MSFTINFADKSLEARGRSHVPPSLKFFPHPQSTYQFRRPSLPSAASSDTVRLVLTEYLASGNVWDFWLAHHPTHGKVVLKIVDLRRPPSQDPYYDEFVQSDEIIDHALQEEKILLGRLGDLQGILVPWHYGIFRSDDLEGWGRSCNEPYLAMILEYAGEPFGPGQKIFEAYRTIHLRGVLHGDISSGHLLYDDHGRVRLIKFRRSVLLNLKVVGDVYTLVEEAGLVRTRFGGHDPETLDIADEVIDYFAQLDVDDGEKSVYIDKIRYKGRPKIYQFDEAESRWVEIEKQD